MTIGSSERVVRHLREAARRFDVDGMTDGQLLDCFVSQHDEAAFAALVRRHAAMVWGVCRRVVGHAQDTEDAFQATFLVLVRRAAGIRPREQVGNWLYGVAHRTALKARSSSLRRRSKEKQCDPIPEAAMSAPEVNHDLQGWLDQELSLLPDKYRLPIVLCDLEGRTRRDVARQLKVPDGTLSNRLAAGRRMLARRLLRHGISLSAGSLAAALLAESARAAVPGGLVLAAIRAAAESAPSDVVPTSVVALTEGVMKAMLLKKLKLTAVVLTLLGALAATGGLLLSPAPRAVADPPGDAGKTAAQPATDRERLQGAWLVAAAFLDGNHLSDDALKKEAQRWVFTGDTVLMLRADQPGRVDEVAFSIDAGRAPKTFDHVFGNGLDKGKICPGLYRLDGDVLVVSDNPKTKERPSGFMAGSGRVLVFRRAVAGRSSAKSDAEFLTSACQELCKRKPTELESRYFQEDQEADKRARVTAWLLQATPKDPQAHWQMHFSQLYRNAPVTINRVDGLWHDDLRIFSNYDSNTILFHYDNAVNAPIQGYFRAQTSQTPNVNAYIDLQYPDLNIVYPYVLDSVSGDVIAADSAIDDATWLRRLMLDITGILPTNVEMQYFLADKDVKKRKKVTEWLLNNKEFARRWMWIMWQRNLTQPSLVGGWYQTNPIGAIYSYNPTAAPDRVTQLLTNMIGDKKSDSQILEALTLATMARFPTDGERSFILTQVAGKSDRPAAWTEVLATLRRTNEAKEHGTSLQGKK
jgi:RNA polymerase sigma factor (sigma-70 family)